MTIKLSIFKTYLLVATLLILVKNNDLKDELTNEICKENKKKESVVYKNIAYKLSSLKVRKIDDVI